MPGIKPTLIRLRLALTVLALQSSFAAFAEQAPASSQSLEWSNEAAADPAENFAATDVAPLETSQDDVWQRIRGGFKIDDAAAQNPLVSLHESRFAAKPDYIRRMVDRSRRYLFHIVQEVDRRAMPMEVALLPMIESAFNPTALSPSAASGIWQFIPSTGRHYGLKQDHWYDGRRDFPAATNAALDYLSKLYLDFGDWQLALAAYNCGEGCVARAIQKNAEQGLPTDYASLTLPAETRNYVPKLLAIKNLVRNPEQYGIEIDALPNQPYFNQVTVQTSMDIPSAARLAEMSQEEFLALNAAFPRKLIYSDTPVNLLLPVDKADQFQRNLEAGDWDRWQPYVAQQGERPGAIADQFGVSLARLSEVNQFHLKRGKLARSQTILVPLRSGAAKASAEDAPHVGTVGGSHVVQRGDTLFGVARRYGLSVAELNAANPDLDGTLRAGQRISLPGGSIETATGKTSIQETSTPRARKTGKPVRYTVKRGDTLHGIAERFDVSLSDIKAWNPAFKNNSMVRAGQSVIVKKA